MMKKLLLVLKEGVVKMKIDTSSWGEFCVGDLFDIHPTKSYKATNRELFEDDGVNPVVVNSAYNNGVGGYTNKKTTEKAGIITFSDTTSADSIFYQPFDFVGYAHVQGMYPIGEYKDKWTERSLRFFVAVFHSRAIAINVDYVKKFTRDSAKLMKIYLPITKDKEPDWAFMENYIKQVEEKASSYIDIFEEL